MMSEPAVNAADYNHVVDQADLVDVKLLNSAFVVEPDFFLIKRKDYKLGYACEFGEARFDEESGKLVGVFHLEAGAKKSRKWLLRARSVYIVAFAIDGSPTQDAALKFAERVGKFACFPYFRSHFSELCGQAGASMPTLPILKGNLPRRLGERASKAAVSRPPKN